MPRWGLKQFETILGREAGAVLLPPPDTPTLSETGTPCSPPHPRFGRLPARSSDRASVEQALGNYSRELTEDNCCFPTTNALPQAVGSHNLPHPVNALGQWQSFPALSVAKQHLWLHMPSSADNRQAGQSAILSLCHHSTLHSFCLPFFFFAFFSFFWAHLWVSPILWTRNKKKLKKGAALKLSFSPRMSVHMPPISIAFFASAPGSLASKATRDTAISSTMTLKRNMVCYIDGRHRLPKQRTVRHNAVLLYFLFSFFHDPTGAGECDGGGGGIGACVVLFGKALVAVKKKDRAVCLFCAPNPAPQIQKTPPHRRTARSAQA
eukprot:TRINITY_DN784_c0_g1_i1.p1 TRINITY_DN784_c0_g1~~TRINITY_DN784_c0_g1_i1.p1  ORF type:complete len:322 (-),score=-59.16 TRINITY_DN784_c0_g1_i1:42-1007(-)